MTLALALLLVPLAASAPPEGVDLEDTSAWQAGAEALLDGPPGCWEVVGTATWDYDFGRFAASKGNAAFAGRLVNGVWTGFHVHPLGEVQRSGRDPAQEVYEDEQKFFPLLGRFDPGRRDESAAEEASTEPERRRRRDGRDASDAEGSEDGGTVTVRVGSGADAEADADTRGAAVNALRETLDALSDEVEYSWAEWSDAREGVLLKRVLPIGQAAGEEVVVETFFPGGGTVPTTAVVVFPESFTARGGRVPVRVVDAAVQLRGRAVGEAVFPSAEAYRVGMRFLGMDFAMAQTVRYTQAAPCAPSPAEDP